jgi:acyl-CoA reductase-like NAD-dependent aldehyde dehydrogenase
MTGLEKFQLYIDGAFCDAEGGRTFESIKAVRSGIVWVNTYRAVSPVAPFGGYGESGLGRESGMESGRCRLNG